MRVPEILGWLLEDVSAIRLYCGQDQREEVAAFFKKTFDELWVKAVEEVAGGYYIDDPDFVDMFPNYNASCTTEMEETGVLVRLPSLVVEYNGGDHYVDARAVLEKLYIVSRSNTRKCPTTGIFWRRFRMCSAAR